MRPKSSSHDLVAVLRRCARQDRSALDLLKAHYTRPLEAYARCCLPADRATPITIDTFTLIWRYAPHYTTEQGEALGWLMSIYRHRLAQEINRFRTTPADITNSAHEALAPLVSQLIEPTTQSVFLRLLRTLDPTQQKLVLGRYLFAWTDSDCVIHTGLDQATVAKQLQQSAQTLSQQLAPWAIDDQTWQAKNALACIDALNPKTIDPEVMHRRQNESAATQDTLRWEALLAQLCVLLEPDAATALGVRSGTGQQIDPTPINETEFETEQNLTHSQAAGLMHAMQEQEQEAEDSVEDTHLLIHALQKQKRRSFLWQLFAFFNLLIVIGLAMLVFLPRPAAVQVIEMAPRLGAVLQAPGHSATPGWVLSVDPQGQVLLMPLVQTDTTANQRVHLWTRAPNDNQLRSLGLIDPNQPVTLTTDIIGSVAQGQLFEMTLEQANQANTQEPTGPILFMGRVVSLGDYEVLDKSVTDAQPGK